MAKKKTEETGKSVFLEAAKSDEKKEDSTKSKEKRKSESKKFKKEIKLKNLSQSEFDKKVIELSKKGFTSEKIGEELRKEGIHPKEHNRKISRVLRDNKSYTNPDLKNVEDKLERIKKHHDKNKQDKRAMREKDRVFSQLRKLKAYFNSK